jgi:Putative restriction endonuclease
MSPERVVHGDVKYRVARALDVAIAKAKVPCRFVLDSAAVRIDQRSLYQPDALVYCRRPRIRRRAGNPQSRRRLRGAVAR